MLKKVPGRLLAIVGFVGEFPTGRRSERLTAGHGEHLKNDFAGSVHRTGSPGALKAGHMSPSALGARSYLVFRLSIFSRVARSTPRRSSMVAPSLA